MSERITVRQVADLLKQQDRILILTHQFPDGDTLGSGYGLCYILQRLGKQARVLCADAIPEKYDYFTARIPQPEFEPAFVCAVDVADKKLLGETLQPLGDRVTLCIDHHGSHREFAERALVDAAMGATAMIILQIAKALGFTPDALLADCLYTGIATDTGCFKYSNTTPLTHCMAAELIEAGCRMEYINRVMFDMKSRERIALERAALESIRFTDNGRCAFMFITETMLRESGATENDTEGLSPIPRQIEGVWVGVTLREKANGDYKVSVRTGNHADASAICVMLGGGGHPRAAGCTVSGTAEEALAAVREAVLKTVPGLTE